MAHDDVEPAFTRRNKYSSMYSASEQRPIM